MKRITGTQWSDETRRAGRSRMVRYESSGGGRTEVSETEWSESSRRGGTSVEWEDDDLRGEPAVPTRVHEHSGPSVSYPPASIDQASRALPPGPKERSHGWLN